MDEIEKKLQICYSCDKFVKSIQLCRACGCFVPAKVRMTNSSCPLLRWEKELKN